MIEDIYDYPDDALVQFCRVEGYHGDPEDWTVGEHLEDMDGAAAKRALVSAMENSECFPLYENGKIMGYGIISGNQFCYTDCDDQTYEEYYGEPYQA